MKLESKIVATLSSYKSNPDDPATVLLLEEDEYPLLDVGWFIQNYNLHDWMDKEYMKKGGILHLTDKYLLLDLDILSRLYQAVVNQQLKDSINNLTELVIILVECHKLIEDGFNVMYETH